MSRSSRTSSIGPKSPPERVSAASRSRPRRDRWSSAARAADVTSEWHALQPTRFSGLRLTRAGLVFSAVTVLLCIAALNTESNLLFLVFALCAGGPILNLLVAWRRVRRLSVRRVAPSTTTCGYVFNIRYELRADRRFGRTYGLVIREHRPAAQHLRAADAFAAVLAPSGIVTTESAGVVLRRGLHELDCIRVESAMPFGLARRVLEARLPHRIVAYPRLGTFDRPVLPNGRVSESGSARAQLSRRMPDEFFGLREYRIGDNPQWIHWRRSARTGELLVREMATRRARELLVVVDHRATARAEDRETLVSCAASLACDALERGFRVGLIGLAADLLVLAPVAGRSHRERLLYETARLHGEPADAPAACLQRLRWPADRGATAILLAARDDAAAQAALAVIRSRCAATRLLAAGSAVMQVSFRLSATRGDGQGGLA